MKITLAFILGFAACYFISWYSSLHGRHQVMETIAFDVLSFSNLQDTYTYGDGGVFERELLCKILIGNEEVAARAKKVNLNHERDAGTKQLVEASARAAKRVIKEHPEIVSTCGG